MLHNNEEWCKIWRWIDLLFQNWQKEFDRFWPEHSKASNICTWNGSVWTKYMYELKKYRGLIFHDSGTEDWYKIWRKTNLWAGKWHEEFVNFLPEHLKFSKLGLWWDPLIQSTKCMGLKFTEETEELCVMTMKNNARFKDELTCHFKINRRNSTNFDSSTQKSQKSAL